MVGKNEQGGKYGDFAVESSLHHLQLGWLYLTSTQWYAAARLQARGLFLVIMESPAGEEEAHDTERKRDGVET